MPTVYDLLRSRFGGDTEVEPFAAFNADVADALMLHQDPRRIAFTLINTSVNQINVRRNAPVTATAFIAVPAGALLTVGYPDDLHIAAYEWHIAAPAGPSSFDLIPIRFTQADGQAPAGLGAF